MKVTETNTFKTYTVAHTAVAMVNKITQSIRIFIRPQMRALSVVAINKALSQYKKKERLIIVNGSVHLLNSKKIFSNGMII